MLKEFFILIGEILMFAVRVILGVVGFLFVGVAMFFLWLKNRARARKSGTLD